MRCLTWLELWCLAAFLSASAENWPCWRGPRGDGSSLEKQIPIVWSPTNHVRWKTAIPGIGHASPVIWEDRLFTISALGDTMQRVLVCLDRKTGQILWQRAVFESPLERKHSLNSYASSTPATDGKLVYVSFLDRRDMVVAAYDFDGAQQWIVRPGPFSSMHGFCSSPVLFQDKVILNGDHDGDSYLIAISREDGRTLWKTFRKNHTRSYCVPIIRELSGKTQMILSGDKTVASYDPDNGALHWMYEGPTEQFVASIVYNPKADLLFMTGGFPELHILAMRHDGHGTVDESAVAWRRHKGASYVPSPISEGDYFLIVSDGGVASCFEAKSGKLCWQERMPGDHHASLVSAEGLVYFLSDSGITTIVKPGPKYDQVSRNEIGEACFASPAISNGELIIRGDKHVFCIDRK